jgi:hypothetical protein
LVDLVGDVADRALTLVRDFPDFALALAGDLVDLAVALARDFAVFALASVRRLAELLLALDRGFAARLPVLDFGVELLARERFCPAFRAVNRLLSAMSRFPPLRDLSLGSSGGQCPALLPRSAASDSLSEYARSGGAKISAEAYLARAEQVANGCDDLPVVSRLVTDHLNEFS